MSLRLHLLTLTSLGGLCCLAQESTPLPVAQPDPAAVSDAIRHFFDSLSTEPSDEVVAHFSPMAQAPPPGESDPTPAAALAKLPVVAIPADATPAAAESEAFTPVTESEAGAPVTESEAGAPVTESEAGEPVAESEAGAPVAESEAGAPVAVPGVQSNLTVKVETIQTGSGAIDSKSVKLLAPFPAKPLAPIPSGWRLETSAHAPPFIRKVELAPGASVTLNIRPHLLVPDADGSTVFSITEPGFNPDLGYRQALTVSAILATSIQQLDSDAKQLGQAIDQLQQLVAALPQPAPAPTSAPVPPPPAPTILPKPPKK